MCVCMMMIKYPWPEKLPKLQRYGINLQYMMCMPNNQPFFFVSLVCVLKKCSPSEKTSSILFMFLSSVLYILLKLGFYKYFISCYLCITYHRGYLELTKYRFSLYFLWNIRFFKNIDSKRLYKKSSVSCETVNYNIFQKKKNE